MSKTINTVLGPIKAEDLGKTLMHEHLIYRFCEFQGDSTWGSFDELNCIKENMKQLVPLKEKYGFKTIVDATNNECGRDPFFLAKMATILEWIEAGLSKRPASLYVSLHFFCKSCKPCINNNTLDLSQTKLPSLCERKIPHKIKEIPQIFTITVHIFILNRSDSILLQPYVPTYPCLKA